MNFIASTKKLIICRKKGRWGATDRVECLSETEKKEKIYKSYDYYWKKNSKNQSPTSFAESFLNRLSNAVVLLLLMLREKTRRKKCASSFMVTSSAC